MVHLERLSASNLVLLDSLGSTTNAPPWTAEVEDFVRGEGARDVLVGSSTGLIAFDDGEVVGAAILKPHGAWSGAALLRAFVIGVEHRGRHLSEEVLALVLSDPAATDRSHVVWLVHPANAATQAISARVADEVQRGVGADGYDLFIFDR